MIRSPRANSLDIPITFVDHGANVSLALVPVMAEFEPLLTSAVGLPGQNHHQLQRLIGLAARAKHFLRSH